MHTHVIQHVPFEGLGSIEHWLNARGSSISYSKMYEPVPFPDIATVDLLIILGGPMSVNEDENYPWLAEERAFIKTACASATPTLGICLGAQMIAAALGAKVYPNTEKEIGWFSIFSEPTHDENCFSFPKRLSVFQWHGDTFELPNGAIPLASSPACKYQAFQWEKRTLALQFHLETTPESMESLLENCSDELGEGKFIQTEQEIRSANEQDFSRIHSVMEEVLVYLVG